MGISPRGVIVASRDSGTASCPPSRIRSHTGPARLQTRRLSGPRVDRIELSLERIHRIVSTDSSSSASSSFADSPEPVRSTGREGSMTTAEIKARVAQMFGDTDDSSPPPEAPA